MDGRHIRPRLSTIRAYLPVCKSDRPASTRRRRDRGCRALSFQASRPGTQAGTRRLHVDNPDGPVLPFFERLPTVDLSPDEVGQTASLALIDGTVR